MYTIALKSQVFDRMSDDEFVYFCLENRDLRIERTAEGEILIDMPTYPKTGRKNAELIVQLGMWNKVNKRGLVFDSSSGFFLRSTAMRSPDVSWISHERWNALSEPDKDKFSHVCPDFVIELKSETDSLKTLQKKMTSDWIGNGCRLAWLIDAETETAYVYRADGSQSTTQGFDQTLSGEGVLEGFVLDLRELKE